MYYQAETSDNIQAAPDGNIQTLYLMNPNYIQGYTDTQQHQQQQHHQQQSSNMIFLNGHALNTASIPHAPLQQPHHFVGVPLPSSDDQNHGLIQRLWGGNGTHQSQIPSSTVVSANSCGGTTTDLASQLGFQRPIPVSPPQQQQQGARGLSLSLSPHQQVNFRSLPIDHNQVGTISSPSPSTNIRGSLDGISSMILGSKYLKAAQEILDEVVNVGKISIKGDGLEGVNKEKGKMNNESMPLASDHVDTTSGGESSRQKNGVAELTTAQRQELQMKKAKLVSMLEEVDQRYRQYHHQMQIIISSFEQVAGIGSAKSYTQLALHAISKQFRCLKDAIVGQIKGTSKNLGEEEGLLEGKIEGSRLKYVDHHLRQQRALQQLGMMQPNAWRPQRGLPERAVSVLRAWLFEHFLHPYPKDSDKIMLAKQTGLTRSQVSNWFINARVRLWKPMVEEMYLEEVKNNQDSNSSQENKNNNDHHESNKEILVSKSSAHQQENNKPSTPTEISTSTTISTSPNGGSTFQAQAAAGFSFNIGSLNMESTSHDDQENNAKKPRHHHDMQINSPSSILSIDHHMETKAKGFNPLMAAYTMGEFGRFNPHDQQMASNFHANGVSLTLGLPPSENLALQGSQQNYLSNQNIDLGNSHYSRMSNPQANTHPNISYEDIDFQSGKRFPTQLLPDFVA